MKKRTTITAEIFQSTVIRRVVRTPEIDSLESSEVKVTTDRTDAERPRELESTEEVRDSSSSRSEE